MASRPPRSASRRRAALRRTAPVVALLTAASVGCRKSPTVGPASTDQGPAPDGASPAAKAPAGPHLDLATVPTPTAMDERYKGVFSALDGEWQGSFRIYVNSEGQAPGPVQPSRIDPTSFKRPPFTLEATIEVRQSYISESPFFQRVRIEDRLPDGTVVKSEGVNKVEDGVLWCLVKKPDDFVVHEGRLRGPRTIIWSRSRPTPLAIERFEERVTPQRYTIVGWGYYGNDDPTKAPRRYFEAEYTRPAR